MDETLRIYWQLYYELYPNDLMIHKKSNPLRDFEEEFIDGPILELGCGQSNFLVEFSKTGKEIFAIDNEDFQLELLKNRIESYFGKNNEKLQLLNITIPEREIPKEIFSIVIASDFLHFFSFEECEKIVAQIISRTKKGSLIYIKVHSKSHSYNKSDDPGVHNYFKHFFSESDLTNLFDEKYFERIIFSDTTRSTRSKFDRDLEIKWTEKVLETYQIIDEEERQAHFENSYEELNVAYLEGIYRRK